MRNDRPYVPRHGVPDGMPGGFWHWQESRYVTVAQRTRQREQQQRNG